MTEYLKDCHFYRSYHINISLTCIRIAKKKDRKKEKKKIKSKGH